MPCSEPVLTDPEARRQVGERGFGGSGASPTGEPRVGVELEWFAVRADAPHVPADFELVRDAVGAAGSLPGASRVSFEPGGQLELSSPALCDLRACRSLRDDLATLTPVLDDAGVALLGTGVAPFEHPGRVVHSPRYDAMEAYFDGDGAAGRTMMRSTAALQVNVDHGGPDHCERRWQLARDLGPVLAAAFANSPIAEGRPTGWRSTRLAVWFDVDAGRSAPVASPAPGPEAWADYALDARVMLMRRGDDDHVAVTEDLTFGDWIDDGHPLGYPTAEDLDYHLTTLFPPVRPRGWLELRMIDALPDPWWPVAAAVSSALLCEPGVADRVEAATAPVRDRWDAAARHGLTDPALARAACDCFATARSVLEQAAADGATRDATDAYIDRYVARGRCPADDQLDAWTGPAPEPAPAAGGAPWT